MLAALEKHFIFTYTNISSRLQTWLSSLQKTPTLSKYWQWLAKHWFILNWCHATVSFSLSGSSVFCMPTARNHLGNICEMIRTELWLLHKHTERTTASTTIHFCDTTALICKCQLKPFPKLSIINWHKQLSSIHQDREQRKAEFKLSTATRTTLTMTPLWSTLAYVCTEHISWVQGPNYEPGSIFTEVWDSYPVWEVKGVKSIVY